jgi:hypothetical protein
VSLGNKPLQLRDCIPANAALPLVAMATTVAVVAMVALVALVANVTNMTVNIKLVSQGSSEILNGKTSGMAPEAFLRNIKTQMPSQGS